MFFLARLLPLLEVPPKSSLSLRGHPPRMYSHTPDDKQTHESANRHTYTSEYSDDSKRESYMDPNARTNQRRDDAHQQNLHSLPTVPVAENFNSFAGFSAYVPRNNPTDGGAMGISEPGSPILIADDQHSNESLSSGDRTKIDTRSPGSHQAIPSAGKHGSADGAYNHHNRQSDGYDAYNGRNPQQPGYVAGDAFSPSSPAYGRYRPGAYATDGLESGRASTIGTDSFNPGPYNSSRTALNHDWRHSDLGSQDGTTFGDEKYAPGSYPTKDISDDLKGPTYVPIPPSSPAIEEKRAPPPPAEGIISPPPVVVSRQNRLEWIDGIRGLASLVIFTHHFSDLTWAQSHPEVLPLGSIYGLLRNGQLAVGMYFLLGGRVLAHSFLRSAFTRPMVPKDSHGVPIPGGKAARWTGPRWLSLSSSLFRRSIRLAFPAIIVAIIQWRIASQNMLGDRPVQAAQILSPTALWLPTWNSIGSFGGLLQFCLDLFTNRGHQYMLSAGIAQIGYIGRYLIYFAVCGSLWFINSPNMLYVLGLWLADLHAAGFVRKLQDHWKPTMLVEISVMILALAMISGGSKVSTPADNLMGDITVYDGKFGWDQSVTWPQYMFISNWLPPLCILIWVEVSHAMQWLASWSIFTWLGKVSYGFYLMQFITLYSIMPPVIIYLNGQGKSYWDMVMPAYIICLLFNIFLAWIGYHLLDRVGLKLAKWIWDGFFVTKPTNAAPGELVKSAGDKISTKYTTSRKNLHTIMNWRTPCTRPAIPDPTDPDVISQLHSTRWTSDMSGDPEAVRTAKLLRFQQHTWIIHITIVPIVSALWVVYHPTVFDSMAIHVGALCAQLSLRLRRFLYPDLSPSRAAMEKKPVFREYGQTKTLSGEDTTSLYFWKSITRLTSLTSTLICKTSSVRSRTTHPWARLNTKPEPWTFRYHVSLGVYDWILHMDEESTTDGESLRRCLEFIRYVTPHHFGQGIILYNGEGYWDNWYFTVADGIRVGDDLARFHFQNTVIHRPVFGVHGSFLMTNGEMENECTWDFGSLAEDFEFSKTLGGVVLLVAEFMESFVSNHLRPFEISSNNVVDGLWVFEISMDCKHFLDLSSRSWGLATDLPLNPFSRYGLPHFAVNLWIVGVFTLAVTIINIPFLLVDKSLTPLWVAVCADFCFVTFYWLYLWGLLFQELDYGQKWWRIMIHIPCAVVIQPFASIAEGLSAIWAMSSVDFGKFEVIVKYKTSR
ncbi:hypothetical protein PSHT_15831 [Puccinia striiformis]|uniref:Uncharacterized protein n=1 Tax=Puccinia striiformis TaxID=27350 RepID=A0A2S4UD44_9BASI|nr:hypothetical protein PSHT_15831 [Puccinia striiformis]